MGADWGRDKEIRDLKKTRPVWRQGVVTSVSPLEVSVGGGSAVSAKLVGGAGVNVGSQVQVLQRGSDLLVLGVASDVASPLGTLFRTEAAMDFASSTATANLAYYARVVIPAAATITGIYYRVGGTSNGNVTSALYDSSGTRLANRATGTAQATAAFGQGVAFDSTVALPPGVYVLCLVFSSGTATFRAGFTYGAGTVAGPGAGATPTTVTFPSAAGLTNVPVMATY